jgi:hypothetical protein
MVDAQQTISDFISGQFQTAEHGQVQVDFQTCRYVYIHLGGSALLIHSHMVFAQRPRQLCTCGKRTGIPVLYC